MSAPLTVLVDLGSIDGQLRSTEGKLLDLSRELDALGKRKADELEAFERRKDAHEQLRRRAHRMATEVDELDSRVRGYQVKLDNEIISYKEMEHLREQIRILSSQMDALAEESLGLMEEAEKDAQALEDERGQLEQRLAKLDQEMRKVQERRQALESERATQQIERDRIAAQLPSHLLDHYERLREQLADPLVPVEAQSCGGCHLRLSETTVDRVRSEREVVRCENCSRFLYWSAR